MIIYTDETTTVLPSQPINHCHRYTGVSELHTDRKIFFSIDGEQNLVDGP